MIAQALCRATWVLEAVNQRWERELRQKPGARMQRDGLTYTCGSDEFCKTEIMCFPLENTKPGTCLIVGGPGTGVTESN